MRNKKAIIQNTKNEILNIYQQLLDLSADKLQNDVSPIFENLQKVTRITDIDITKTILKDTEIKKIQPYLRKLWANYEYQREKSWALEIYNSSKSSLELSRYPVYNFYEKIIPLEFGIGNALYEKVVCNVLFIGSGPLPLSSIILAKTAKIHVDGIDILQEACDISTKLVKKLKLQTQIRFICTDICAMDTIKKYDIIILSTLAGETIQEKLAIFEYLNKHMRKGQILIIRTVQGLKSLLYQESQINDLKSFKIHFENKSSNIISRIIVAQKQ
ncbi:MAG: nicotianamine synthase family protein [Candidatus Levybacteria bacterium]|nr:nicotianamine synthase family protein [Candidatus Levybacteria bacterium]